MDFNQQKKCKSLDLEKQRPSVIFERTGALKWVWGIKKCGCKETNPVDKCLSFEKILNERKKKNKMVINRVRQIKYKTV